MSVHPWVFASSTSLPTVLLLQRNIYNGFDICLQSVCPRKPFVKVTGFIYMIYKKVLILFFFLFFPQKNPQVR